jgi:DNA-binding CsgD family transcriptional regulator
VTLAIDRSSLYDLPVPEPIGAGTAHVAGSVLTAHADDLYRDVRLVPLLRRLINASCRLTDAVGGSISVVDPGRATYTKTAERGTPCRLGQSFSLDEGVTGQVMRARRPVVLARYSDVPSGHLPPAHPCGDGPVAAIPIWWRGDVVGVNVIFAGRRASEFDASEVDQLEALTQLAAPGFIAAAQRDLSPTHISVGHAPRQADPAGSGQDGDAGSGPPSVGALAVDLISLTARAGVQRSVASGSLHVAVVPADSGLRLLVRTDSRDEVDSVQSPPDRFSWQELVDHPLGGVVTKAVPADGTLLSAELSESGPASASGQEGEASPFTRRETQVASLLACGLGDRAIAKELVISPKTVEKHVGAVLRKTGSASRTAAVVRALAGGWLDAHVLETRLSASR